MKSLLLTVLLACVGGASVHATHIIGGEMFYDHLGGNQYQITMDLYRDCGPANNNNTGFDGSVSIGVFNASGTLVQSQNISFTGEQLVPIVINNPCLTAPPNVCIATTRYQAVFNLPPIPGGYHLSYQRCCRTPAILNLQVPGNQGLTCTIQLPGPPNTVNSSPRFDLYPPVVLCLGETTTFDHGATDPDGDILAYEFCTPFQGGTTINPAPAPPTAPPYALVPWAGGYSAVSPLPSAPAISLDPVTGLLVVTPTQIGVYTIGVCVREFRNGVLLGETRRDFMFTVVACDPNIVAVVPSQVPGAACNGLTQSFGNQSINGQFWHWDFGDPNTLADTSNIQAPSWTYAQPGTYTVMLIANPGWPCADTSTALYDVYLPLDPSFIVPTGLCGPSELDLQATGNFTAAAAVDWVFPAAAIPATGQGALVSTTVQPLGSQPITVNVSENGCADSFTANVTVNPVPVPVIQPQQDYCVGLTMAFAHSSSGASSLAWDFGDPTTSNDASTLASPSWTYAQPGTYTVTLTADPNGPCTASTTALFDVYVDLTPVFVEPPILCPGATAVLTVTGDFGPAANVLWDFGTAGNPSSSSAHSTSAVFAEVGEHPITVFVEQDGCAGSFTGNVVVHPFPVADLDSDSRACVGALFYFENLSEAFTPMTYLWSFGDGSTATEDDPLYQYQTPGVYTVSLTATTTEGCIGSNTVVRSGQVEVFPDPVPGFSALPREVSVFDPNIEVEDYAQNTVAWTYTVENNVFYSPSFAYSFAEGGQFIITQTVTSGDGCEASMELLVIVSDHIFWAPNVFTPDGDGLNDEWLPTVIGARHYELEVFDRWGASRFRTTDPREGWGGDGLPSSVFTYKVRVKEWGANAREYVGHFTLLR